MVDFVIPQDGFTPLIVASREGHTDAVQLLIGQGADINAKNNVSGSALSPPPLLSLSPSLSLSLSLSLINVQI